MDRKLISMIIGCLYMSNPDLKKKMFGISEGYLMLQIIIFLFPKSYCEGVGCKA